MALSEKSGPALPRDATQTRTEGCANERNAVAIVGTASRRDARKARDRSNLTHALSFALLGWITTAGIGLSPYARRVATPSGRRRPNLLRSALIRERGARGMRCW